MYAVADGLLQQYIGSFYFTGTVGKPHLQLSIIFSINTYNMTALRHSQYLISAVMRLKPL